MTAENKKDVLDCLVNIQKKLLARGYTYHDADEDLWPDSSCLMCLDEVAILMLPLPEKIDDEFIKTMAAKIGRFSATIIVGDKPIHDKAVSRLFSRINGRYAYIDMKEKTFRRKITWSLLNPLPRALDKSSLREFIAGNLSDRERAFDCRQLIKDHFAAHAEVEEFLQNMTEATGVKTPIVTKAMIAVFVAIYLIMIVKAKNFAFAPFAPQFLLDWGACFGPDVAAGQWWRIITSGFVHASLTHIIFNSLGCWYFGSQLEQYQGRSRLVGIFLFAVIIGNLTSLAIHPDTPTVGASGGLFGLIGMMAAMTIRYYREFPPIIRNALKSWIVSILMYNVIFILLPQVNFAAHVGGFVGGLVLGLVVARPPLSKRRPSIAVILITLLVLFVTAQAGHRIISGLTKHYGEHPTTSPATTLVKPMIIETKDASGKIRHILVLPQPHSTPVFQQLPDANTSNKKNQ